MLDLDNSKLSQSRIPCQSNFPRSPRRLSPKRTHRQPYLVFVCGCDAHRACGFAPRTDDGFNHTPFIACGCCGAVRPHQFLREGWVRNPQHTSSNEDGHAGVLKAAAARNRQEFLIPVELGGYGISQIAIRLFELRRDYGCVIDSRRVHPIDPFVTYFWRSGPPNIEELLSNPDKETDWYERATGRKRPMGLPLFDGMETQR